MNPKAIYLKSYHFLTLGKYYNLFTFKSRAMHVQKIIDTKSITEIKQEITSLSSCNFYVSNENEWIVKKGKTWKNVVGESKDKIWK